MPSACVRGGAAVLEKSELPGYPSGWCEIGQPLPVAGQAGRLRAEQADLRSRWSRTLRRQAFYSAI